jgi:hypothetical protein
MSRRPRSQRDARLSEAETANETHALTTDPDARLARKGAGKETKLSFTGHLLMENCGGLIVVTRLTPAMGTAERDAALAMLNEVADHRWIPVGADNAMTPRTSSRKRGP